MTKVTLHPSIPLNKYAKNHLSELSFGKEKPHIPSKTIEKRNLNWFGKMISKINNATSTPSQIGKAVLLFGSALSVIGIPFLVFWIRESMKQGKDEKVEKVAIEKLNMDVKQLNQEAKIIEKLQLKDFDKIPTLDLSNKRITDYIDILRPKHLTAPIMKGIDPHGRPFIALKLDHPHKMVVTLFQRYTDGDVWTWGCTNDFNGLFWEEIHSAQIYSDESYEFFRKIVNNEHEKFVLSKS